MPERLGGRRSQYARLVGVGGGVEGKRGINTRRGKRTEFKHDRGCERT